MRQGRKESFLFSTTGWEMFDMAGSKEEGPDRLYWLIVLVEQVFSCYGLVFAGNLL